MNKPQHTPPPWTFVQGGSGNYPTWNVRIGPSLVYLPGVFDMAVMDANARLISAAPDLLDALRVCAGFAEAYGQPETREKVRAAIQKATTP